MKKNFAIYLLLISIALITGEGCKSTKIDRAKVEAQRQEQILIDSIAAVNAAAAMENLDFIVNGNRVTLGAGRTFNCDDASTNFVSVHDGRAMLQLASMRGMAGLNGLGGVTLEGRVAKSQATIDKKGTLYVSFNVSGPSLSAFVSVSLPKGGTNAIVQVKPNFGRELTMYGTLSLYDPNKIFVGSKPF